MLTNMLQAAEKNALRPRQGFRYDNDWKRFVVHNRILSGLMAFQSMQMNLKGCFPSISTTNRYIHRSDHAIIEGELRSEELLIYLKQKNQPMWVSLSEDGTRVDNRVQYDSRTNQLIGFILPMDQNGMPIPFCSKARTSTEILRHFSSNIPVAHFINTVMAKPIGNAPAFCLLINGSNNRYSAQDVSKRWIYITQELKKIGIGVLSISSDSDPKSNAAMRINSYLGNDSSYIDDTFKCGSNLQPPFYIQDYSYIATKLRNLLLKTIDNAEKLPFGDYFIQHAHLQQLIDKEDKDKHLLTATVLNPADRQNFSSAMKICDDRVIDLLIRKVDQSEGTAIFLRIMSNLIHAFDDRMIVNSHQVSAWKKCGIQYLWCEFGASLLWIIQN